MSFVRRFGSLFVVGVVVAGCAGGDDAGSTTSVVTTTDVVTTTEAVVDTTVPETTTTVLARVDVGDASAIELAVDLRDAGATEFVSLSAATPVGAGDVLRTDATGFAEIAYFDGSITRLDVDTEFEILELVSSAGESSARTRMGLGRTWHRVESLGEDADGFSVETSVATAVVRGTAFSVECVSETQCRFVVVEGAIEVVLPDGSIVELVAPAALEVTDEGAGEPVAVPFDGAFGDEWLLDNATRDATAGFATPAEVFEEHGPQYGSIIGTFTGERTIVENICDPSCPDSLPPVGDVAQRTYVFDLDCSGGVPCVGLVLTDYRRGDEVRSELVPASFDGTTYRWQFGWTGFACSWDDDGDGNRDRESGSIDTMIEWTATPTAGEIRDGVWMVTAFEGTAEATNTMTDPADCTERWVSNVANGTIVAGR